MQHGAGGGFDGLLFAGADGTGKHAALWRSVRPAPWKSVAARSGVGLAACAADSAGDTGDFAFRSGFDSAGCALFT